MTEEKLQKNIVQLGFGIEACLEKKLMLPALVLIYTAIDTVGWLDSNEEFATKLTFTKWVENYLLKVKPLACTSLDLYAARCGLLHTFSPDSKLSLKGKARCICYAWGTGDINKLQHAIDLTDNSGKLAVVHADDLYEAWRLGTLKFIEQLENDPCRKSSVYQKANRFFSNLSMETIDQALAIFDKP